MTINALGTLVPVVSNSVFNGGLHLPKVVLGFLLSKKFYSDHVRQIFDAIIVY